MDNTKEYDADIEAAVHEGRKMMAEASRILAPHPLDTVPVKPEDMHFDWQNRGVDYWPKMAGQALQNAMAVPIPEGRTPLGTAVIALLKHDKQMQEKANG